jgi:hypothetical protein
VSPPFCVRNLITSFLKSQFHISITDEEILHLSTE